MHYPPRARLAFSLVELSIVLVILGLLVGGVLSGQSLIRASELRAASAEIQTIRASMNTFRDKYFALPGDMNNATQFWTSLGGTGADAVCQAISATSRATCNGNGDGNIDTSTTIAGDERYRAWQHLANAGLIEGSFTGVTGPSSAGHRIAGVNMLRTRMDSQAYHILIGGPSTTTPDTVGGTFAGATGISNELRRTDSSGSYIALFKPEELWNIDTKFDDGRPAFGIVTTYKNQAGLANCLTTAVAATAAYNLSEGSLQCNAIFNNL